jgi:hypothetical protein
MRLVEASLSNRRGMVNPKSIYGAAAALAATSILAGSMALDNDVLTFTQWPHVTQAVSPPVVLSNTEAGTRTQLAAGDLPATPAHARRPNTGLGGSAVSRFTLIAARSPLPGAPTRLLPAPRIAPSPSTVRVGPEGPVVVFSDVPATSDPTMPVSPAPADGGDLSAAAPEAPVVPAVATTVIQTVLDVPRAIALPADLAPAAEQPREAVDATTEPVAAHGADAAPATEAAPAGGAAGDSAPAQAATADASPAPTVHATPADPTPPSDEAPSATPPAPVSEGTAPPAQDPVAPAQGATPDPTQPEDVAADPAPPAQAAGDEATAPAAE